MARIHISEHQSLHVICAINATLLRCIFNATFFLQINCSNYHIEDIEELNLIGKFMFRSPSGEKMPLCLKFYLRMAAARCCYVWHSEKNCFFFSAGRKHLLIPFGFLTIAFSYLCAANIANECHSWYGGESKQSTVQTNCVHTMLNYFVVVNMVFVAFFFFFCQLFCFANIF